MICWNKYNPVPTDKSAVNDLLIVLQNDEPCILCVMSETFVIEVLKYHTKQIFAMKTIIAYILVSQLLIYKAKNTIWVRMQGTIFWKV